MNSTRSSRTVLYLYLFVFALVALVGWLVVVAPGAARAVNASSLGLSKTPGVSHEAGDVSFALADLNGDVGGAVEIPLHMTTAKSVGALSLDIVYDPGIIKPVECVLSSAPGTGACNLHFDADQSTTDRVRMSIVSPQGFSGQQTIATLTFRLVGNAGRRSDVLVEVRTTADTTGATLSTNITNGSVQVTTPSQQPPVPTPPATLPSTIYLPLIQ